MSLLYRTQSGKGYELQWIAVAVATRDGYKKGGCHFIIF